MPAGPGDQTTADSSAGERPSEPAAAAIAPGRAATSEVIRAGGQPGAWEGIDSLPYRHSLTGGDDHRGSAVTRRLLAGGTASGCAFELRYFELAPGGRTARERHQHAHAVVVLRGAGEVRLGEVVATLAPGDLVRVAPAEPHQFRNPGSEPFGFLCVVDAERDAPTPLDDDDAPSCSVAPGG